MAGAVAACRLTSELTLQLLRITVERPALLLARRPCLPLAAPAIHGSATAALTPCQDGWGGPAAVLGGPGERADVSLPGRREGKAAALRGS
jgi:hypothetical protein